MHTIKHIHFIGIGGIGMSALARYFKAQGAEVSGYDLTPTALTAELQNEGIPIHFDDEPSLAPSPIDVVVYTPAIPPENKQLLFYREQKANLKKRSELLGLISQKKNTIAVAGSHGKTTVSTMIAHILTHSGYGCSAFLGGISTNYHSNFLNGTNDVVVIEADEFDRSFHHLQPMIAVVTAVDTDHLDIYGSKEKIDEAFLEFVNKIDEEGYLVMKQDQSINDRLPENLDKSFYSLQNEDSDVYCSKYWIMDGGYAFNLMFHGTELKGFRLNMGGYHNIENAIAAITVAMELRIDVEKIKAAIGSFLGIKRRFETILKKENILYIDDYAHHPEEIRAFLNSILELYPNKKITAIFQPHLFSRTKDLAEGFAEALSIADEVLLLPIYPAREKPIEGISAQLIFDGITAPSKMLLDKEQLLKHISEQKTEVVLTIGAGDIDKLVEPIKEILKNK